MEGEHWFHRILAAGRANPGRATVLAVLGVCSIGLLTQSVISRTSVPMREFGYVMGGRHGHPAGVIWAGNAGNAGTGNAGNTGYMGNTGDPNASPSATNSQYIPKASDWNVGRKGRYARNYICNPRRGMDRVFGGEITNFLCRLLAR